MTNKYFPAENVTENDLFFVCYMIERVARKLKQPNRYVVNALGYDELYRQLSLASVLHSENPVKVENDWIEENQLESGSFDISAYGLNLTCISPLPFKWGRFTKGLSLALCKKAKIGSRP